MSLRTGRSLKRSTAVADLTQLPMDAPLSLDLQVQFRFRLSGHDILPEKEEHDAPSLSIGSLQSAHQLRALVEPYAYHEYIRYMERAYTSTSLFYTRTCSPSLISDHGDLENVEEEEVLQGRVDEHDRFLKAISLYNKEGVPLRWTEPLCLFFRHSTDSVYCVIDIERLLDV